MIEVVMSLSVVSIGLVGILSLMARNIQISVDGRDQAIASQLSQEGLELVLYAVRNKNASFDTAQYCLDYTYTGGSTDGQKCAVRSTTLSVDAGTGLYTHSGGTSTKFRRIIDVASDTSKYTIISYVRWDGTDPDIGVDCDTIGKCAESKLEITKN